MRFCMVRKHQNKILQFFKMTFQIQKRLTRDIFAEKFGTQNWHKHFLGCFRLCYKKSNA